MQHCILCNRLCDSSDLRPGTPVRCELHRWKELGPWGTFSVEEAKEAGRKRVAELSPDGVKEEGLLAFAALEEWQAELANPEVYGGLRQHVLDVIAAKRAYLSAFD